MRVVCKEQTFLPAREEKGGSFQDDMRAGTGNSTRIPAVLRHLSSFSLPQCLSHDTFSHLCVSALLPFCPCRSISSILSSLNPGGFNLLLLLYWTARFSQTASWIRAQPTIELPGVRCIIVSSVATPAKKTAWLRSFEGCKGSAAKRNNEHSRNIATHSRVSLEKGSANPVTNKQKSDNSCDLLGQVCFKPFTHSHSSDHL